MKKLDAVPVLVDEDVHIPVAGIAVQDVGHYAAKRMITLSHVGRLVVQHIPHTVVQAKLTAGRPDYTLDKVLAHLSLDAHHRAVGSAQFDAEHLGCRGLLPAFCLPA